MSKNLRSIVGTVAAVLALGILLLWLFAPRMTEETVMVQVYGWGAASIVLALMYGVPFLSLAGLAWLSYSSVLGKKHATLESSLSLVGRDVRLADVDREVDLVDDKREAALTHRLTCPTCAGNIAWVDGILPIVCDVDARHAWPHERALWDALVAVGNQTDADTLARVVAARP